MDKLKLSSSLQLLFIVLGFVFALGVNYNTLVNLNVSYKEFKNKAERIDKDFVSKLINQRMEFNKQIMEINVQASKIEGKLEILINEMNK